MHITGVGGGATDAGSAHVERARLEDRMGRGALFQGFPALKCTFFPGPVTILFADQRDRWLQVVTSWLNNEPARRPNVVR